MTKSMRGSFEWCSTRERVAVVENIEKKVYRVECVRRNPLTERRIARGPEPDQKHQKSQQQRNPRKPFGVRRQHRCMSLRDRRQTPTEIPDLTNVLAFSW